MVNMKPPAVPEEPPAIVREEEFKKLLAKVAGTEMGVPEPQAQEGARNVTTAPAKLRGIEGPRVLLDASPARGFVGGAALDGQGQLAGMIDIAPAAIAGPAAAAQVSFVPTASIRKFLDSAGIVPATGRGDVASARNAVVRVICVRK